MSLPVNIADPSKLTEAKVFDNQSLKVSISPSPPVASLQSERIQIKPFNTLIVDENGSSDMNVDGSSTSVEFALNSSNTLIVSITEIRMIFHSTNMNISNMESRRFGPIAAPGLTNGLQITLLQDGQAVNGFFDTVKVLGDFYKFSAINGITNDTDAISNGVDFFMIIFQPISPVVIFPNTTDKIFVTIEDDLSGIQLFNTLVRGTRETIIEE